MSVHTEDMNNVPSPGELVDEAWYRMRISSVKEELSQSSGEPIAILGLKIQDEGPFLGRVVVDRPSLQPHALFKLKAYYKAVGYNPGPEGHDPEKLLDGELYVLVQHGSYQGQATHDIKPWAVRSLQEGPGKMKTSKPTAAA